MYSFILLFFSPNPKSNSSAFCFCNKQFCLRYETEDEIKQRLDREYGKDSPAYQQAVVEQCIEADRSRKQESSNIPKCPTCGSTNIKRITGTERAVSILGLGVFSKKINKSYKCVKCKSTW